MQLGCSRNRHYPRLLCQQPCECDLGGRSAFAFRNSLDQIDKSHIGLARLRREARHEVPKVDGIELRVLVDLARQETGTERTEWHEANPELFKCGEQLGLRTTIEQRVL